MSKIKNSLVVFAGLSLVIGLLALITPARSQGQDGANQHPLNVNVVNSPTVTVTDLYPAPFQREMTLPNAVPVCVSVPEDRGLIIELVTARTFSDSNLGRFVLGMRATAGGGSPVTHNIPLQRQEDSVNGASFFIAQPLRAYADPGTELCFSGVSFDGGPFSPIVSFSGQLVNVP